MYKTVLLQLWFLVRSVIDGIIDLIFRFIVYDETKKKIIPKIENDLLLESAISLARKIRQKEVTAEKVVSLFIERIKQVNPIINAVVDTRFDLAIKEAQEVDLFLKTTTDSLETLEREKPFLGIPFTTKESTSCAGLNYTFGLLSREGEKGQDDAEVVRLMKEAGAILLGVTNVPEVNLWVETRNYLYGQTLNPYNTTRTVGGSSGGEASIISACGTPIGIGTDIGGSIRIPAFCCGIFGHKPTTGLTSMKGTTRRTGEEKNSMATAGPMTKHQEDLIPFLKVLVKNNLFQLKLDEKVDLKNINFFYFEESDDPRVSKMSPELTQALRRVVNHCQEISGKPCRKVKLGGMESSYKLWRYWMTKEPYRFEHELGNRKRKVKLYQELPKKLIGKSEFTMAAIYKLIDQAMPQENPMWCELMTHKLKIEIMDILQNNGVLLCPSSPTTAGYHYSPLFRPFNLGYWAVFNVLKLPVTQVPVGLAKDGLPMGIQVVAANNMDHLTLAVAAELEKCFGGWVPPFKMD